MKIFKKAKKEETERQSAQPEKHPLQIAFEKNLKFLNHESYPTDFFQSIFTESEKIKVHVIDQADFATGEIVLGDPLAYLGTKYQTVLEKKIPKGSYPVEISVLFSELAGLRIAAARLKVRQEKAVGYKIAMPKGCTDEDFNKPGVFTFFGVDAGMACITDISAAVEYDMFLKKWHGENPDKNHYDDYFAELFAESCKCCPELQREGGDFISWRLPETGSKLIMFASGLGDGIYSGYWGLDEKGEPVELVVPFLNPEYFM